MPNSDRKLDNAVLVYPKPTKIAQIDEQGRGLLLGKDLLGWGDLKKGCLIIEDSTTPRALTANILSQQIMAYGGFAYIEAGNDDEMLDELNRVAVHAKRRSDLVVIDPNKVSSLRYNPIAEGSSREISRALVSLTLKRNKEIIKDWQKHMEQMVELAVDLIKQRPKGGSLGDLFSFFREPSRLLDLANDNVFFHSAEKLVYLIGSLGGSEDENLKYLCTAINNALGHLISRQYGFILDVRRSDISLEEMINKELCTCIRMNDDIPGVTLTQLMLDNVRSLIRRAELPFKAGNPPFIIYIHNSEKVLHPGHLDILKQTKALNCVVIVHLQSNNLQYLSDPMQTAIKEACGLHVNYSGDGAQWESVHND